ncbi:uncharacterized protein LOC135946969 [Cloeon dipterum]|uniref:uncharacterized protein LOC135946969 n=1 Tax=Cloeon dipterum TaxID=197152 RepID=UPI0032208290
MFNLCSATWLALFAMKHVPDSSEIVNSLESLSKLAPSYFLYVVCRIGWLSLPLSISILDLTLLTLYFYLVNHLLAWQDHLIHVVENMHIRNRRCVVQRRWLSDIDQDVFDIKYIVETHKYTISFADELGHIISPIIVWAYIRVIVLTSNLMTAVFSHISQPLRLLLPFHQFLAYFVSLIFCCYYGSMVCIKNDQLTKCLQYNMAYPRPPRDRKHPDWRSVEVLTARANLGMCIKVKWIFFTSKFDTDTLKRVFGYGLVIFELLRYIIPLNSKIQLV